MTDQPTPQTSPGAAPGTAPITALTTRDHARVQNIQPMLDTDRFEHFQRASKALMHSSILNESVRGSSPEQCFSNLMLVFDLSDRWKLPALSIAQGIAIVHNKVVYEGKLIAAMLDASLGVRLHYWYQGERGALDYRVYVSDQPWDDLTDDQLAALTPGLSIRGRRVVDGAVGEWRTFQKNGTANPAWTGAATQNQLAYRGAREWARRYEPAQMLGVYGDDEIDAMTIRMEARDVTPPKALGGLSAGFTAPSEPEDATFTEEEVQSSTRAGDKAEGATEPDTPPETPAEPAEGEVEAKGPKARKAKPKAPADDDGRSEGQKKDAEALKAGGEEATKRLERCIAFEESAHACGLEGKSIDNLREEAATDEERRYLENGYAKGNAEREAAARPDPKPDLEGDDQTDDALEAVREAEPDLVDQAERDAVDAEEEDDFDAPDALDLFVQNISGLNDWAALKSGFVAVTKSDAWGGAGPERQARTRAATWMRQTEIADAGGPVLDFLNDLTAYRCWIEFTDDAEAIEGNWRALIHQDNFKSLAVQHRKVLEDATKARMKALRAA